MERENREVLATLKSTANACFIYKDADQTLRSLDGMINRMQGLKRKLATLHAEERSLHQASKARLHHLDDLYRCQSLADVKYDEWSKVRLNRLLVEYLVRQGFHQSAAALAREEGIENLVDLEVHARCHRIGDNLRRRNMEECLAWCSEHRVMMRKIEDNRLEFELRLQQYIELCRSGRRSDARSHAIKHLAPHWEQHQKKISEAAVLLVFTTNTNAERYRTWYSQSRWDDLASLFIETHNQLFSLPTRPLLLIALSAGLSALKTPSCHSKHASSTANASSTTTSVCPICSTELNELARPLPYAHHTKSEVENDPVVLPNGRVYGRSRLLEMSAKTGVEPGQVKDPTTSEVWPDSRVRKVYIS